MAQGGYIQIFHPVETKKARHTLLNNKSPKWPGLVLSSLVLNGMCSVDSIPRLPRLGLLGLSHKDSLRPTQRQSWAAVRA